MKSITAPAPQVFTTDLDTPPVSAVRVEENIALITALGPLNFDRYRTISHHIGIEYGALRVLTGRGEHAVYALAHIQALLDEAVDFVAVEIEETGVITRYATTNALRTARPMVPSWFTPRIWDYVICRAAHTVPSASVAVVH